MCKLCHFSNLTSITRLSYPLIIPSTIRCFATATRLDAGSDGNKINILEDTKSVGGPPDSSLYFPELILPGLYSPPTPQDPRFGVSLRRDSLGSFLNYCTRFSGLPFKNDITTIGDLLQLSTRGKKMHSFTYPPSHFTSTRMFNNYLEFVMGSHYNRETALGFLKMIRTQVLTVQNIQFLDLKSFHQILTFYARYSLLDSIKDIFRLQAVFTKVKPDILCINLYLHTLALQKLKKKQRKGAYADMEICFNLIKSSNLKPTMTTWRSIHTILKSGDSRSLLMEMDRLNLYGTHIIQSDKR